jgi:hypothetical protein
LERPFGLHSRTLAHARTQCCDADLLGESSMS